VPLRHTHLGTAEGLRFTRRNDVGDGLALSVQTTPEIQMTNPNLGRLATVPPRDVWVHEAHDFTPWLLQNVDVLSDLLGMDLVLEVAEHPVGGFSLDLLGRDLSDDSVVIVENQVRSNP
jgi:hypothetical protein